MKNILLKIKTQKILLCVAVIVLGFLLIPFYGYAAVTGIAEFGEAGSGNGQFNFNSTGVAVDSAGNVYVADSGNNRIQKFNSSGAYITQWGAVGTDDGELTGPDDIAIDSNGDVWVLDSTRVQKFSNTGTFIASYNGTDQGGLSFSGYDQLAIDGDDNVYVGRWQLVQVFTGGMVFVESFDGDDKGGDTFNGMNGLEFDASNNLYVNSGGKIQKFDDGNDFVTSWTGGGSGGLGVTADGTVYTSQSSDTQIKKYTTDGTYIESFGYYSTGVSGLVGPSDIDFYGQTVYVVEQGSGYSNERVNIFTDTEISSPPLVTSFSPADDAMDVDVDTAFSITFSENINEPAVYIEFAFGLYKASDDSVVYEIPNSSPYLVTNDNVFSLVSLGDLDPGTEYYIKIGDDYLDDDEGNYYAGINDETTWNFTTAGTAPSSSSRTFPPTPTCSAVAAPSSVYAGQESIITIKPIFSGGQSAYYIQDQQTLKTYPAGEEILVSPSETTDYAFAIVNTRGANYCETTVTVEQEPKPEPIIVPVTESFVETEAEQEEPEQEEVKICNIKKSGLLDGALVRRGYRGAAASMVQEAINLTSILDKPLKVDGWIGSRSSRAIKKVQEFLNVKIDGMWGEDTHDAYSNWLSEQCFD